MPTPRLSVVLPVHREQAYLRECVSSVLRQEFSDFELLAVDNASPDHGPEILDELAGTDARLDVRHLEAAVGLGEARNLALASATGDYVWFVETTDLLSTDALAAVVARLDETAADVLFVGHERVTPLGRTKPSPRARDLHAVAGAKAFELEEQPRMANLGAGVWDKLFRRDFLGALGAEFASGRFGELAVTYPALLTATRISVLDRVCYVRREPANAAEELRVHGTLFDVFAQYDRVFEFADADRARSGARRLLPLAMLRHYLSILDALPEGQREEFFARMSESYGRHARGDECLPESLRLRLLIRLVEQGRYGSFRALDWGKGQSRAAGRLLAEIRRRRARIAHARRRASLERHYRLELERPIEPDLAVFAAYWYRGYACNPRAIYEKICELVPGVRGVWIVDPKHEARMPKGVEYVVSGTRDYYSLIARAKYFVNNVNFPNEFLKRESTIHVQTHHGTPLKTMGLDLRGALKAGSRMNFELLLRRCSRWDYSISSNAFSTLVWERVYPTRYETLEVGYPRNDALVNATEADVAQMREKLGIAPGRRSVLYAPTHREYLDRPPPILDPVRLADGLGAEYVVMVRTHYLYESDRGVEALDRSGRVLDVTDHSSIEELCLAADVLVTDYSAVMFDYAVLDRPIVVHIPDWEVYRTLRGTYLDLPAEPPGVVTRTDDELVAAFRSGAVWSDAAAGLRAAFRARFCALEDGRAAERVVRRVWLSEEPTRPAAAVDRSPRATIAA